MPDRPAQFVEIEQRLRQAGINSRNSQRLLEELQDHYDDRLFEAQANGHDKNQAASIALRAIGAPADIVGVAAQYRDLLTVARRHPFFAEVIAGFANGLIGVVSAPAMPICYCIEHKESIARWSASAGLAAMLMAGMLLSLQTLLGVI